MNDGQNNDIQYSIAKFSALTCPSNTQCTKCVKVQTVYDAYHGLGLRMASCDKCEQTLYECEVVLHCPPNHRHHHEGYDLCVKCGEIILKKQQREQQSIMRQVAKYKDNKRKIDECHMNENNNNHKTDLDAQSPPKKKRKRGRPRKYPLPISSTSSALSTDKQPTNTPNTVQTPRKRKRDDDDDDDDPNKRPKITKIPSVTHYRDWEKQIIEAKFLDNYMKYLRTAPNLCENAIKIINRYSSWLDFVRLNEGSEMNILNVLCEFESIISTDAVNMINTQSLKELNDLSEYLTTSDIDYKHIWSNVQINATQIDEHDAIAKYASNYMAHNSLHQTLFGENKSKNRNRNRNSNSKSNSKSNRDNIRWKQISQMIEQSHFIRDWKLNLIDNIIQKQINILQSLISQHATLNNSLATNCKVITASDLKINIWKRHILKLRRIRMKPNVGLEFPMNVLNYDRTEIDHIAKIAAINGIQHTLNDTANKPALPPSAINTTLTLRDLLPSNLRPINYAPKQEFLKEYTQCIQFTQQRQQQKHKEPKKHHKPKSVCNTANNVQNSANITHLIQNLTNNNNIDIKQLINALSNAQNTQITTNTKHSSILHQLTAHLLSKQQQQQQQQQHIPSDHEDDSSSIEFVKVMRPLSSANNVGTMSTISTISNVSNAVPSQSSRIDLTNNTPPIPIIHSISPGIDTRKVTQVYSDKQYWDKFHDQQKMEHFEWFCHYDDIAPILDQNIGNKNAKILEIGCGLSSMASRMVLQNGYRDILCLDWCESAVDKIQNILNEQYKGRSKEKQMLNECIGYTVQDIRSMTFERRTFDVVIDKGTLDAIDCGVCLESDLDAQAKLDGSGKDNLSDNFEEIVAICSRIHEILKPNGLFIIVTSRSIVKRIEFVDELKACHKRHFQKIYGENISTELKDWRDGDSKTPKLIILKADKNSRKHKHKKHND